MSESAEILSFDVLDSAPVGILVFDEKYTVKYVNDSFFSFNVTDYIDKEEIVNKDILRYSLFHDKDISDYLIKLSEGIDFEIELLTLRSTTGSELTIFAKCTSLFTDGIYKGGILVLEDIKFSDQKNTSDELLDSNTNSLLSILSDKFYLTDNAGLIKYSSPFDGLKLEKNIKRIDELFNSSSLKGVKNLFSKLNKLQKGVEADLPLQINGSESIVNIKLVPYTFEKGGLSLVAVMIKDVTSHLEEKINIEHELNELRRYQIITSTIVDAVISVSSTGKVKFWNESAENLFGVSKSEIYGKFISKVFPSITEEYFEILKKELIDNKIWEGELNGKEEEEEFYKVRMGIAGEEDNLSIVMLCLSITEQANAEKALRQSEERFRNIVTNTHEYICTLDEKGNITYINPYFRSHFDYTENEILSFNFRDLLEPKYLRENEFKVAAKNLDKMEAVELPLAKKNGEIVYVLASFAAVLGFNNELKYYIAVLTDITEKKQAENDLLLIKTVFEASRDGIAVTVNRKLTHVNKSFIDLTGHSSEDEILGRYFIDFVSKHDTKKIESIFDKVEAGKKDIDRFEFDLTNIEGDVIGIEGSVARYIIEDRIYIVSVLRDISEEKKQKQKLVKNEERYRSITENINESLWSAEPSGNGLKAVLYTQAIKDITGYSPAEFLGNPFLWFRIIHPSDVEEVVTKLKRIYKDPARTAASLEYRIINSIGNTSWIENKLTIDRTPDGKINRIYGLVADISLSKRAEEELKKTANDLRSLNETKDRFLSIISHDLRTPFSSILGFTDFLLEENDIPADKQKQYIEMIKSSSNSMLALVNSLLDWTRLQTGRVKFEPQRINARKTIDKSIDMLSGVAMKKSINLFSMLEGDIYVHADDGLLMQVFNNLISNAIKFTNEGGDISVNVFPKINEQAIEFSVNDNGIGIKEEDQGKLFNIESKYTTPGTSGERGSGLGLSLVHDIIKKHGGDIRLESEYGKGTRIYFSIPIASSNVLLVDDSKKDRLLYSKIIKSFLPKHEIIEASEGEEAFEIIKASPPALVITDHYMKGMNGYGLVKQLKYSELKYKPPVIVLSGDINEDIEEEYQELGIEYVFKKPVNLKTLKQAIDNSLKKAIYN